MRQSSRGEKLSRCVVQGGVSWHAVIVHSSRSCLLLLPKACWVSGLSHGGMGAMQMIVTVTMNPTIDTHVRVDHVIPERKLRCQAPRHEPGGGGINVSRAMHQLGGAFLALYPVGGPTGQMLQHLLAQEGLTTLALPIADWTRESFVVLEETSGQQYLFVTPGPTLQEREWQQCLDTLATLTPPPEYIVASGSLPPGVPVDFYAREIGRA